MLKDHLAMLAEIGVISDTHGLLRDEAIAALTNVDAIIHAGDIGAPEVIGRLGDIAPVYAIRGNVDKAAWAKDYPDELVIEIAKRRFRIIHDIKTLDCGVACNGVDVIVCGHSHKPRIDYDNGVLILNPGSAGHRRFRLPVCLATITIQDDSLTPRIVELI